VQGEGRILAVDNGDPLSHLDLRGREMTAFRGKCLAVVQSTKQPGNITLRAHAGGLEDGQLVLTSSTPGNEL